jgi:uncharacterized membrane protein
MTVPRWTERAAAQFLCCAAAHAAIFAGLFRGVYTMPFSGTGLYYDYAGKLLDGALPYRDFVLEYPPFALVFFSLPRLLGESFRWYYVWFQVEVVVFDLVIVAALLAAARWWNLSVWRVLAIYTVAVLAVGPNILHQFDIFPAALSLLAVIWFGRRQYVGAGISLGLAIMTKAYPALLAPVFVLAEWHAPSRRGVVRSAVACAAACVAAVLPWLILAPTSLGVFLGYHAHRGIHLDSSYGSIALALHSMFITQADVVHEFGSWDLAGPIPSAFARASTIILLATVLWCFVIVYREALRREAEAARDVRFLAHASALVLAASLCASKVLTPSYLVWLLPFVPLVAGRRARATWVVFAAIGALTYYIYPVRYPALLQRQDGPVALLVARSALLVVFAVLLGSGLRRRDHA